jgi:hypothetical protein
MVSASDPTQFRCGLVSRRRPLKYASVGLINWRLADRGRCPSTTLGRLVSPGFAGCQVPGDRRHRTDVPPNAIWRLERRGKRDGVVRGRQRLVRAIGAARARPRPVKRSGTTHQGNAVDHRAFPARLAPGDASEGRAAQKRKIGRPVYAPSPAAHGGTALACFDPCGLIWMCA